MGRPKDAELTQRELEVMHVFWDHGEQTIADAQKQLEQSGRELAYTTVATLVRILCEKHFLKQTTQQRPHRFQPRRTFQEVSGNLLKDIVHRVFGGSREALLARLMEERALTDQERQTLEQYLAGPERPADSSRTSSRRKSDRD